MEIQCPKCLKRVDVQQQADVSGVCPACGEGLSIAAPVARKSSAKLWIGIAAGVVAVLLVGGAILLKLATRKLETIFTEGQRARVEQDLSTFESATNLYRMVSMGFPSTEQGLDALVSKPTVGKIPSSYEQVLKHEVLDPWEKPYGYRFPSEHNQDKPDIWSFGPDGVDGTEDDIGNWD